MSVFAKVSGILGINARNLLYVSRFNSRKNRRLADDKLYTKRFLHARGIGVAKLFAQISSSAELHAFKPDRLPRRFVIKPNKGYGGEGIIAVQDTKNGTYTDAGGKEYRWADLYEHSLSILDGRYAISGLGDTVLFEELLEPHDYFRSLGSTGLPDIRVIIFKYVPVIAMLRLPTPASSGKANLHLGAIGVGIDLGTGRGTYGVQGNRLIRKLPGGDLVRKIIMPQWQEILQTAAKTQYYTQIGYLAVDLALTNAGIKILELNARAGLAIQISNQALLRKRLEKVADLKVASPSEGVRLGQTLFTRVLAEKNPVTSKPASKPIVGLYELIHVLNLPGITTLSAKIDPHSEHNVLSSTIAVPPDTKLLNISIKDKKLRLPFRQAPIEHAKHQLILSGKFLTEFLIDATRQTAAKPNVTPGASTPIAEKIIYNIDQRLARINEQIHLLARIKPTNTEEEYRRFMEHPTVSPQFNYTVPTDQLAALRTELKKIPRQVDHPLMPLFLDKITEITNKLKLAEGVDETDLTTRSAAVYGTVTERQYRDALTFVKQTPMVADSSKILKIEDVIKRVENYLLEKKLTKWKIKLSPDATAGMQVTKNNTIIVDKNARISINRLKALIAHEVETHIFRLENGRLQKYRIFEQGTAGYLTIEEGLAIYNQNRLHVSLGDKFFTPAHNVIAIYLGMQLSFVDLYHQMVDVYGLAPDRAWRTCVRVKRGLSDTGVPGAFTKDAVYFTGNQIIERLVKEQGEDTLKKLYIGKIKISDLQYVSDFRQWPIKYFPE
ncbi:MAG: tyrosine/phenylalanine carboxypeptidase domain-containing protein [Patescibacteria group bacterium]